MSDLPNTTDETDAERLARMDQTGLVTSAQDIVAVFRAAKPLSAEGIALLVEDAKKLTEYD